MEHSAEKKTIVLIDDDTSVLSALKLLLTVFGFVIKEFSKPREAVSYITSAGTCNMVLCDLRMPELDGIGVLKEVKAFNADLPFVLISGHATAEDVARAKQIAPVEFLGKPFSPEKLRDLIAALTK